MNKSIITIAIALITLSSCTKDSLEDGTIVSIERFDDHDHEVVYTTEPTTLIDISETY